MKLLDSDLDVDIDEVDDPGDYPNALASCRLKTRTTVELIGSCTIQLSDEDMEEMKEENMELDDMDSIFELADEQLPPGFKAEWTAEQHGNKVILTPESSELEEHCDI